jgi:uroporphyrinogen decarboxylase
MQARYRLGGRPVYFLNALLKLKIPHGPVAAAVTPTESPSSRLQNPKCVRIGSSSTGRGSTRKCPIGRIVPASDAVRQDKDKNGQKKIISQQSVGPEPALVDENNPLVKDLREIPDLKLPDPNRDGRLPVWLEATRELVSLVGDHVFVMGRADQGPFDLMCLLRGTQNVMMELITEEPQVIWNALDWCREANLAFAKAQKDAGAHATSIGDSYAGPNLISPEMYRQFAWEHEVTLARQVQEYGIPWSLHICGDTTHIAADMGRTGAKILEIDWKVDMAVARQAIPDETVLMGNIDPSHPLVYGTPEEVDTQVREIIRGTRGVGLFISSGCAMGRNTKPENMAAMVGATREYGMHERLMELQGQ